MLCRIGGTIGENLKVAPDTYIGYDLMKKTLLSLVVLLAIAFTVNAQEKNVTELKSEREQLAVELQSEAVVKRQDDFQKLAAKAEKVEQTNLGSIDGLAETSTSLLATITSANELLKNYRTEIIDNGNGEVEIAKYAANLNDYIELGQNLAVAATLAADGAQQLKTAKDDVKKLNPLKAKAALNSVNFSTDAINLSVDEIALQTRIVTNLIQSIKASKNL